VRASNEHIQGVMGLEGSWTPSLGSMSVDTQASVPRVGCRKQSLKWVPVMGVGEKQEGPSCIEVRPCGQT
jgi:hypothetical protein